MNICLSVPSTKEASPTDGNALSFTRTSLRFLPRFLGMSLLTAAATIFVSGCATPRTNPNLTLMSESEYYSTVGEFSDRKQVYDGLYAIMEVSGTLHNSKVIRAQLDQNARIYQWNQDNFNAEKAKQDSKMAKETEIFLSFFVPERKHDDLAKSKTLWKLFLDVNGKRYEGKVVKVKTILAEVTALYPNHNRWFTPYRVSFPVPTAQVENSASVFTITGPAGSTTLNFKPL